MKHQKGIFALCVAASVLLGILRTVAMPLIAHHQTASVWNIALLVLTVASLALCFVAPRKAKTPLRTFGGSAATATSAASLFTGFALLAFTVWSLVDWFSAAAQPFPSASNTPVMSVLFILLIVFSALSGVFFLLYGFRCPFSSATPVNGTLYAILALAPIVWSWIRIARYETSFMGSANIFLSLYDLLLLLCQALFFLCFARYAAKPDDAYPRATVGLALAIGILTGCACLARTVLLLTGDTEAAHLCDLVTAPDLGVGVFAFAFVAGQWFAPDPKESKPEPKPEPTEDTPIEEKPEEEEEDRFLLPDPSTVIIPETENYTEVSAAPSPKDPREPLEWEDILAGFLMGNDEN